MATEIVMPKLGLTMTEGTVEKWMVKEGDHVEQGDPIVEISSEKLSNEVEAPEAGKILKIIANEGDVIPSKGTMAYIGEEGEEVDTSSQTKEKTEKNEVKSTSHQQMEVKEEENKTKHSSSEKNERIFITPVARKMAEEQGIDISAFGNLRADRVILISRQRNRGENCDDRDNDHQLDERKTFLYVLHGVSPRSGQFSRAV